MICLTETDLVQAQTVAETIRAQISDLAITHGHSPVSRVLTLSLGVASVTPSEKIQPAQLVEQADKAMYEAKQKGRNCVMPYRNQAPARLATQPL